MARSELPQRHVGLPWMDSIEAFACLQGAGLEPLLLESAGAHPEAKRSIIGLTPHVEVRTSGTSIEESWANGALEVFDDDPVLHLRALTERFRFARGPGAGGFTGGWIGMFGFGFANRLEPTLPVPPPSSTPDCVLRLCLDALVFDHGARSLTLHGADLEDAPATSERHARIKQAITSPPACPSPSPSPELSSTSVSMPAAAWQASLTPAGFEDAVRHVQELIQDGDLFQANLAVRWRRAGAPDPAALLAALREANPAPYMALLPFAGFTVVSASPEQLFAVEAGRIRSRPIAGTRKRGATPSEDAAMEAELRSDAKEQAEHTMLVDLVRNDLARVAVPGSVSVPQRMGVERYRHVMHLVSRVEAEIRPGTTFIDWLAALFPGGTVTGAPKVRATQRILEAEPVPRGFYTGSAGWIDWGGDAHWSILIRGLQLQDGQVDVHAGAGIVAGSQPAREWRESQRKAQALLEAADGRAVAVLSGNPTRLGEVSASDAWTPPRPRRQHPGARVLLIDNYDSFVHDLADYCGALGVQVQVVRNDADWRAALAAFHPTHVVLSPGPGWPQDAGCTPDVARELDGKLPLLGVCLGHQAMGAVAGARVQRHPRGPVHGTPDLVHHNGRGLFAGLPTPLRATRYHSLAITDVPPDWVVDARLADGTVMAIRHRRHASFGVQFHPESVGTEHGLDLLDAFLARGPADPEPL